MLSFFRGLYSGFMLQKLQTPESDTLVFRKYDLFQYFSKINYGSYLLTCRQFVSIFWAISGFCFSFQIKSNLFARK